VEVAGSRSSTEKGEFIALDDPKDSDDSLGKKKESPLGGRWRRRS
jgi:hypothetical protein